MLLGDFDYSLPTELIAQEPLRERDASRMMVLTREAQTIDDRTFRDLPQILKPGDLLVFNNTKVFPARLLGRRRGSAAQPIGKNNPAAHEFLSAEIELLLTRPEDKPSAFSPLAVRHRTTGRRQASSHSRDGQTLVQLKR